VRGLSQLCLSTDVRKRVDERALSLGLILRRKRRVKLFTMSRARLFLLVFALSASLCSCDDGTTTSDELQAELRRLDASTLVEFATVGPLEKRRLALQGMQPVFSSRLPICVVNPVSETALQGLPEAATRSFRLSAETYLLEF